MSFLPTHIHRPKPKQQNNKRYTFPLSIQPFTGNFVKQKNKNTMTTLQIISAFFVISGFVCAGIIALHIRKHPQPMRIMEAVWPLTGLWASWPALWAYYAFGKASARSDSSMNMNDMPGMDRSEMNRNHINDKTIRPHWQQTTLSTLHCGAGCSLADITGEWFTFFIPLYIGGSLLAGQWVLDYILALIIGIFFQYAAIQSMEHLPIFQGIRKAFKVDFLSLTAWQTGMYGCMALFIFGFNSGFLPPKTSWEFWFIMQLAMCAGFLTSYPVNKLLIKAGIKHGM